MRSTNTWSRDCNAQSQLLFANLAELAKTPVTAEECVVFAPCFTCQKIIFGNGDYNRERFGVVQK